MTSDHLKIGLTGSIGMGKSTVLGVFASLGLPTWDADAAVARLYAPNAAGTKAIGRLAPECIGPEGVDRTRLSAAVAQDAQLLKRIEGEIHPLVAADRQDFANSVTSWAAVYDIPLLFETSGQSAFDKVVVVSAPADVQRSRVMARPGMSEEKFAFILSRQMPDEAKRALADHVIDTGQTLEVTARQVAELVEQWKADNA